MVGVLRQWLAKGHAKSLILGGVLAFACVQIAASAHEVSHVDSEVAESCSVCLKTDSKDAPVLPHVAGVDLAGFSEQIARQSDQFCISADRNSISIRGPPSQTLSNCNNV